MRTRRERRARGAVWLPGLLLLGLLTNGSGAGAAQPHSPSEVGETVSRPANVTAAPPPVPRPHRTAERDIGDPPATASGEARGDAVETPTSHRVGTRQVGSRTGPRLPRTIAVPSLDVRAPVVPIVPVNGVLVPPSDPQVIGWWAEGAKPGARTGSAVLTGHTVHSGGGAFDDLDQLRSGDTVVVGAADGGLRYVVRQVTNYPKQTFAAHAGEVFSQEVPGRLVLVTCEDWNGTGYDSNAVVVAEPAR